jgi:hypothetical protein
LSAIGRAGSWKPRDLDAEVVFDRCLASGDEFDVLQTLLAASAPEWCSRLRVWVSARDQRPLDPSRPGALKEAVLAAMSERGPTYRALVQRYGKPPFKRPVGTVELRGGDRDLTVVVTSDEMVLSPVGGKRNLGNQIIVQVRDAAARNRFGGEWVGELFTALCEQLSPAWGSAGTVDEYWAKVMTDSPAIEAVGRDFGRYLPGLFWLNFFGRRLCDHLGERHLIATPAHVVRRINAGVLIGFSAEPGQWQTPEYQAGQAWGRRHLGEDLFFDRTRSSGRVIVPAWDA